MIRRQGIKWQLVSKSMDAFVLALETINRLTTPNKVEAYCIFVCNAWELLLKARVADLENRVSAIYYPKRRGEARRTISLRDAASRVFSDTDPIRRNLDRVAEFRDESIHLLIGSPGKATIELLQACALNYHQCLQSWFEISISSKISLGLLTFHYDLDEVTAPMGYLGGKIGGAEKEFIGRFESEINRDIDEFDSAIEYVAAVSFEVTVVKKSTDRSIELSLGDSGPSAVFLNRPRDVGTTHPLRFKKVIDSLNSDNQLCVSIGRKFNQYDLQAICHSLQAASRREYSHKDSIDGAQRTYSHLFVDKIKERVGQNPDFVELCRDRYKASKHSAR